MATSDRAALDVEAFEQLRSEIGDDRACADFVEMYLDLLPGRLHDLSTSLGAGARPEAAANLAATSRMLGALPLAEHLESIHGGADALGSTDCVRAFMLRTFDLAGRSRAELRRQVLRLRCAAAAGRAVR